jgi:branched-chain amino acid transport system ATP-binding protein
MLSISDLHVSYGSLVVIKGVSFHVPEGEIVAILGSNGAGKTTMLRTVSGLHRAASGQIIFDGKNISDLPPYKIAERGLCMVPEGRQLFPEHTVLENLELGAYRRLRSGERHAVDQDREELLELFPRIRERLHQKAGLLSGGEQQMVAIARALISRPKLLMMDEPSLGLAPILIQSIFDTLVSLRKTGMTLLIVEQMAWLALNVCDRAYVLDQGSVKASGSKEELLKNPQILEAYLGKAVVG